MTQMMTCTIPSSILSCLIKIQVDIFQDEQFLQILKGLNCRLAILTDHQIAALYGNQLQAILEAHGLSVHLFSFPSGEKYKTRQTKAEIEDQLLEQGYGRDTCLIALGGGVVTDLGGYLAATYCRGISLIMIPTSLLAMVDASLGGKTGVNVPQGKNLIGAIYQPRAVFIDPTFLLHLPPQELRNGIVEMIKHGLIADRVYFEFLETHAQKLLALETVTLEKAIFESCLIKKKVVEEDERDKGKRHLLNCGHTIGHALEKLTDYALPHGEAVAIGIVAESYLAVQLGVLSQQTFERIQNIFRLYHLPLQLPCVISRQTLLDAMVLDKKSLQGQPRFVVLQEIGIPLVHTGYCHSVKEDLLITTLDWMIHDLCHR
jgi:3-dehydroquinate synthase